MTADCVSATWSLFLKEDFTAALITLILQENEIQPDRENMRNLPICESWIISKINDYFKAIFCLTGSGKAPGWYECFSPCARRSDTEQAVLQRAALDCEISPLKWSKLQFH